VHFISGLMKHKVPFIVAPKLADRSLARSCHTEIAIHFRLARAFSSGQGATHAPLVLVAAAATADTITEPFIIDLPTSPEEVNHSGGITERKFAKLLVGDQASVGDERRPLRSSIEHAGAS
jgi:hypothetical protein